MRCMAKPARAKKPRSEAVRAVSASAIEPTWTPQLPKKRRVVRGLGVYAIAVGYLFESVARRSEKKAEDG